MGPIDALVLSTYAAARAKREAIDPDFFVSVLLQESSFAPYIVSSAGALGIAQFTYDTASRYGVDPLDPRSAIAGSAALYASYVGAYRESYPDPYAAALAAYDAGPGTVSYYHGVPPYPETLEYIDDVYDRWSRIERDRSALPSRRKPALHHPLHR